jgi:hypothetical protein
MNGPRSHSVHNSGDKAIKSSRQAATRHFIPEVNEKEFLEKESFS